MRPARQASAITRVLETLPDDFSHAQVAAAEVEMVLKKHPKVVDAVVIGLPDPDWGHRIHAIVETNGPVGNKDLIRFALNYLPPYKIPKSIEFTDRIPVNENGKIVRSKLIEESLAKGY